MLKWYLIFLLQTLLLLLTQAQILSIDYGTQFIKASLVHAGAGKSFSIVENPKSQRKFINSVTLHLFSWVFITRNAFMKQIICLKDLVVHPIASSILIS